MYEPLRADYELFCGLHVDAEAAPSWDPTARTSPPNAVMGYRSTGVDRDLLCEGAGHRERKLRAPLRAALAPCTRRGA